MADGQENVQPALENAAPAGIPQEVHDAMQIAFNGGFVPESKIETAAADGAPAVETPPFEFKFDTFKEKYGYEKPEDVLTEIETLRAFKATPPPPPVEPFKFETPESEKLFKAWQAGKEDEVYNYLAEKRQLETLTAQEVTEHNADQLIKLGMQVKFKDLGLSPAEIDHKFNKQYTLPKAPVQDLNNESDEEFEIRRQNHQSQVSEIMMDKMIEAKIAKKELEAAKPKLVLPTIEETVDENYAQYLKALEDGQKINQEAIEAYNKFTAKDAEVRIPFIDEANKISFELQYEPDAETIEEAKAIAKDFNLFWGKFTNQDGTPDRKKFLSRIAIAINPEKAFLEAMKQSKNATLKSIIPDNNQDQGIIRHLPGEQGLSELDKMMKQAGVLR